MGPGWGGAGDVNVDGDGGPDSGLPGIKTLHDAGYNVLTWDPRGFGKSGGTVEVDSPEFEGRDTQALLDFVARQPEVQLDAPGDPRVGMAGGSYGGGIQLVLAAIDPRVDAIAPIIAWHSLGTALYKSSTIKQGWAGLLYDVASSHALDPHIKSSYDQGVATGTLTPDNQAWFLDRGPGGLVSQITAPTLLIQGTVDTLFTLDEAVTNYQDLKARGVPVKMVWFCGGHGTCLTNPGDPAPVIGATMGWFDRYVKRDASVDTGPAFDWVDQNGQRSSSAVYPPPAGKPLTATGSGTLPLKASGGAGPITVPPTATGGLGSLVGSITPGKARNAVDVQVKAAAGAAHLLGAPRLTLSYQGKAGGGTRPTRVFAQLVDDASGRVLGNQITPIPVTLDGRPHRATRPLEIVAHTLTRGRAVTLQVVATTVVYAKPRLGGSVDFSKIEVSLPTTR
jgi:ABC-2 type transport system ATP-binding protein